MPAQKFKHFWLLAFCITFSNLAYAAKPVVHISPAPTWLNTYKPYDKGLPGRSIENGFFYKLIEEQIHVEKQASYSHIIREIVSQAGIQNGSQISISFDPSYERLDIHQVTVWRNGEPQRRLTANAFKVLADEQELSKFIYQGTYSAYCILSDIRKGDKIEYAYTLTGRNPIFGQKYSAYLYLNLSMPVAHIYRSILASPQRKLNFKEFNKVPKMSRSLKNGLNCYAWEDFQVKPATEFNDQPSWYTTYTFVQVSDYSNWQEVADWALKINPLQAIKSGSLARQIALFKKQAGGNKEKYFRLATKMVQDEVRYMGIEIGEYSHRANSPEKVYDQRFGDCKDKSLLLASILTAYDIPAHLVLISTTARSKAQQYLPSPFVFNHAVVVATLNGKQVWVDPTIAYQRGTGVNIYFPNYGQGLIVGPGNNALTNIVQPGVTGRIACHEAYKVLDDNGKASLEVTTNYTGHEADKIRDRLASSGMAETEKSYQDYYARTYPKIEMQDSISVTDNEDLNELTTTEHYLITDLFKKDSLSNRLEASLYADMINEQLPNISNNKYQYPVALNYPYNVDYTVSVVMDNGWNVKEESSNVKKDAFTFTAKQWANQDTLFLNYKLTNLADHIPVSRFAEYKEDVKKIRNEMLSYSFSYAPGTQETTFIFNYLMLGGVLMFAIVLALFSVKIYHKRTQPLLLDTDVTFKPIGGWLVFIAISLTLSVLVNIIFLGKNFFDLNTWNSHAGTDLEYLYKALFTLEALGNTFAVCYAFFCVILMSKKRDIFPKYITGFYIYVALFLILDHIAARAILSSKDDSSMKDIIRAIISAAIWVPYFRVSTRVKKTFIVPHPANNYRLVTNDRIEPANHIDDEQSA